MANSVAVLPGWLIIALDIVIEMVSTSIVVFVSAVASVYVTNMIEPRTSVIYGLTRGLSSFFTNVVFISNHSNPLNTLGWVLTGKFPAVKIAYYIPAQLVGAIIGAAWVNAIFDESTGLGVPELTQNVTTTQGFLLVMTGNLFFYLVFLRAAYDPALFALTIGLTIIVFEIFASPVTGTIINVLTHFGPALVANEWTSQAGIVYYGGSLAGWSIAVAFWNIVDQTIIAVSGSTYSRYFDQRREENIRQLRSSWQDNVWDEMPQESVYRTIQSKTTKTASAKYML